MAVVQRRQWRTFVVDSKFFALAAGTGVVASTSSGVSIITSLLNTVRLSLAGTSPAPSPAEMKRYEIWREQTDG